LKYESHIAVAWRLGVDVLAPDIDAATGGAFQSGDNTQEGRLAASGRSEQNTKLTVGDLKRNLIQDLPIAEGFGKCVNG
jgi:hypothetical protein